MSLRQTAETDLGLIMEDETTGFSWPISVTAPDGSTASMSGFSNDISQTIDPDTGMAVSGRVASIAIRIGHITAKLPGKGLPRNIADSTSKPWIVAFDDINGNSFTFKVKASNPDRALGLVTCELELYTL